MIMQDYTIAMHILANHYYNGEGTEKNLEKAFYWHQKAVESNKTNSKNEAEYCNECLQPDTGYQWCQQCNTKQFQQDFSKWTSKNKFIDKFIQEAQINAKNSYEIGQGIEKNLEKALYWYHKAAENGNEAAINYLALCFGEGSQSLLLVSKSSRKW